MNEKMINNSAQAENNKKPSYLKRFKRVYGIAGFIFLSIFAFLFWSNLKWIIGDIKMYSIMTADELSLVLSTIIPFDSLVSLILMVLAGVSVVYYLKLNKKALLFSFYYIVSYPILLGIVEFGYSGNFGSILGILTGGIIILIIFWRLYKKDVKSLLPFVN